MKVNCKNEGQLQSFKREQFAVRGTNVHYVVRARFTSIRPLRDLCTHAL